MKLLRMMIVSALFLSLTGCGSEESEPVVEAPAATDNDSTESEDSTDATDDSTDDEVSEEVVSGDDLIVNGSFDDLANNWMVYYHADAMGVHEVMDGQLVVSIDRDGNEDYSIHLYQGPFNLVVGQKYRLEFEASSAMARDMIMVFDNASYARSINETFSLGTDMAVYSYEFEAVEEQVTLKFLFGELGQSIGDPYTVSFDNIKVVLVN